MIEFNPTLAELTTSGATAALLLDAQERLTALCVDEVLRKIDQAVANDKLTAERALGFCAEIAAFRRIVYRQKRQIDQGRAAARAQES